MNEFYVKTLEEIQNLSQKIEGKTSMWGISPVAPIHLGYDSLILLQKSVIKCGAKNIVLLADLHSMMSHGVSWDNIRVRGYYWEFMLREVYKLESTTYLYGSYFQTKPDYIEDLYSLISKLKVADLKDASPKSTKGEPLKAYQILYSIMQCLDVFHTDVDIVLAEKGQKKIYKLIDIFGSIEFIRPWRGQRLKKDITFIFISPSHDIYGNPLIQSKSKTRISIHETPQTLKNKIRQMYAPPYNQPLEEGKVNALLEFFRFSVFPWLNKGEVITIKTTGKDYSCYKDFEEDYSQGKFHPNDAKEVLYEYLNRRLKSIRKKLKNGLISWIDFKRLLRG
ncbi:MAG: hypothetical protein RML33_01235 [Acidobacteriota bacterium]|nr:hypothetical protein [Acidobacteriota bacterium]